MFKNAKIAWVTQREGSLSRAPGRYFRDRLFLPLLTSSLAMVLTLALLLQLGATAVEAQPTFSSSSPAHSTHARRLAAISVRLFRRR